MKTKIDYSKGLRLLPNYFKIIGWVIVAISFIYLIVMGIYSYETGVGSSIYLKKITMNIFGALFLIGIGMVISSKEKVEDELTKQLRANSLAAMYIAMIAIAAGFLIFDLFDTGDNSLFFNTPYFIGFISILYLCNYRSVKKRLIKTMEKELKEDHINELTK